MARRFFSQEEIDSFGADASKRIMEKDRAAIDACDVVVALLDGTQVDDGTAWEIGYAYARNKPVVGIRTDFRNAGDTDHGCVNSMIEGNCIGIARDFAGVLKLLKKMNYESHYHWTIFRASGIARPATLSQPRAGREKAHLEFRMKFADVFL